MSVICKRFSKSSKRIVFRLKMWWIWFKRHAMNCLCDANLKVGSLTVPAYSCQWQVNMGIAVHSIEMVNTSELVAVPLKFFYKLLWSVFFSNYSSSSRENGRISMSVLLRPSREAFTSSETLRFLMYESNTSASVSLFESLLARQTETFIELTPELIVCSDDVGKTSISQRNCLYEWERQLK